MDTPFGNQEKVTNKIKERQGFIKGNTQVCWNCFNLCKVTGTEKLRCGIGLFEVEGADTCTHWIPND